MWPALILCLSILMVLRNDGDSSTCLIIVLIFVLWMVVRYITCDVMWCDVMWRVKSAKILYVSVTVHYDWCNSYLKFGIITVSVNVSVKTRNMCERKNTILCSFEKNCLSITAYDIHEWIRSALTLQGSKRSDFIYKGFEVFTGVVMKTRIFLDITPCSVLKINRSFGGVCRSHLHGRGISQAGNQREAGSKQRPWRWGHVFFRNVGWLSTDHTAIYPSKVQVKLSLYLTN
jgi:hypothetical protein